MKYSFREFVAARQGLGEAFINRDALRASREAGEKFRIPQMQPWGGGAKLGDAEASQVYGRAVDHSLKAASKFLDILFTAASGGQSQVALTPKMDHHTGKVTGERIYGSKQEALADLARDSEDGTTPNYRGILKSEKSFKSKAVKREKDTRKMADILRGSILTRRVHDVPAVVKRLQQIADVWEIDDGRFTQAKDESGYHGAVHLTVGVPTGEMDGDGKPVTVGAEVQVTTRGNWAYKMQGEETYARYRDLLQNKGPESDEVNELQGQIEQIAAAGAELLNSQPGQRVPGKAAINAQVRARGQSDYAAGHRAWDNQFKTVVLDKVFPIFIKMKKLLDQHQPERQGIELHRLPDNMQMDERVKAKIKEFLAGYSKETAASAQTFAAGNSAGGGGNRLGWAASNRGVRQSNVTGIRGDARSARIEKLIAQGAVDPARFPRRFRHGTQGDEVVRDDGTIDKRRITLPDRQARRKREIGGANSAF